MIPTHPLHLELKHFPSLWGSYKTLVTAYCAEPPNQCSRKFIHIFAQWWRVNVIRIRTLSMMARSSVLSREYILRSTSLDIPGRISHSGLMETNQELYCGLLVSAVAEASEGSRPGQSNPPPVYFGICWTSQQTTFLHKNQICCMVPF